MEIPPTDPRPAHEARRRILLAGAVLAIAGVATALALGGGSVLARLKKPPEGKPVVTLEFVPAEVVKPAWMPLPVAVEFSGPLVAPRTAIVRAKAAGTLLSLQVAEGHRVKAGQTLGAIDLSDLETRVSERAAMVESAQAALAEAERTHQANIGLAAQNFISPTALQTSQARLDSARAQLKSSQAQLATSRLGVREAALAAPIAGIVGKRHVVPGEKVSAEQPLITVVDLSVLELAGTVGTHEVSLLRPGQPVRVRVEGEREPVAGRIDRIAPQAEAGTRAIGVVVVLENRDERYRAGQYAQANLTLEDAQQRLTLPSTAVGQTSGQDFVWTVEKDALVRRIIVTGRQDPAGRRVEVVRGLAPETTVLAVRFDNLKEGQPARVVPNRSAPTASNPASAAPRS
jgi:RND family efflux transporter MFP subunit